MATLPHSDTGLYWSEDGKVACATPGHAPYVGSDTWYSERWTPVSTAGYLDAFRTYDATFAARLMSCETCGFSPSARPASVTVTA